MQAKDIHDTKERTNAVTITANSSLLFHQLKMINSKKCENWHTKQKSLREK